MVISNAGGVMNVRVGLHGRDEFVVTDATGSFNLGDVVSDSIASAASQLYGILTKSDPTGCETWFQNAVREGALPAKYEALLRKSEIGAVLDHDTFVGLMQRWEVAKSVGVRLFAAIQRDTSLILSFTKDGFAPTSVPVHTFASGGAQVEVRMQRVKELGTLNPARGGYVSDVFSGASVTLTEGTKLVRSDGSPYDGEVKVFCSVIDVTDPMGLEAMPGDLSAFDFEGRPGQLESFGAMYVGLSAPTGERLELDEHSPGMSLSFISSAPATFDNNDLPPSTYAFDEALGKWRQKTVCNLEVEGVEMPRPGSSEVVVTGPPPEPKRNGRKKLGKKKGGADEFHMTNHYGFIVGAQTWTKEEFEKLMGQKMPRQVNIHNIDATGYWNCDRMMETCFVSGQVVDAEGVVVTMANVFSVGVQYSGASPRSGVTENGFFSVLARVISAIEIIVLVPEGQESAAASRFSGQQSVRFKFGSFTTGQPGEELNVGKLYLNKAVRLSEEDLLKQKVLGAFGEWDTESKGWISEADLSDVLMRRGVPEHRISSIFRAADLNDDGMIDYNEFQNWICGSEENQSLLD
eukprot:TRINITY_DN20066_c0_g1_i1.p1 TRINITY_DN20066_c0_g1~~TRINITY_DN20066_c0_g1_i1.p1  ORF type:complete len:651 (+),score=97.20 TRINITY_DN20066_c0_g1_i1:228-1955(+)